jgi:hypothetical protein
MTLVLCTQVPYWASKGYQLICHFKTIKPLPNDRFIAMKWLFLILWMLLRRQMQQRVCCCPEMGVCWHGLTPGASGWVVGVHYLIISKVQVDHIKNRLLRNWPDRCLSERPNFIVPLPPDSHTTHPMEEDKILPGWVFLRGGTDLAPNRTEVDIHKRWCSHLSST